MKELFIGVMSGTSLDGIDLVLAEIRTPFEFELKAFWFQPFSTTLRQQLLDLLARQQIHPAEILAAHQVLGRHFASGVEELLARTEIKPEQVRAIGLHGVTYQHRPEPVDALGDQGRGTWQLGDPHVVRLQTGIPVVFDFRAADMAAGGEGAPLVPFLDRLIFRHPFENRLLLNLGGIANLTYLPREGPILAFDSGPANMLVDMLMRSHPTEPGEFDPDGRIAAGGKVVPSMLKRVLAHPYFHRSPPKSTGRELFDHAFLNTYFAPSRDMCYADLVATATMLTARTVADAVDNFVGDSREEARLICAGGGVHNKTLMTMLGQLLPGLRITTTAEFGVPEDAKEALLMAALAWANLHGIPGNIPEVTGASKAMVLGAVTA